MSTLLFLNDIPEDFKLEGDIAIDTETMGLNLHRDRLCVVQFSNGDGRAFLVKFDGGDYSAPNLKKLLSNEDVTKIFHFARFDLAALKKYLNLDLKNVFCTKVASKLVRTYTEYHGLKELCRELLNIQISKQQQSTYWGNESLTREQMDYAAGDVLYLHEIREILITMLKREGRFEIANKLFEFLPTRAILDLEGWNDIDIFAH